MRGSLSASATRRRVASRLHCASRALARVVLAAAWLLPFAACSSPQRPNVLFIVIDTLRADRLGSYGNRRGLTPFLDSVAAKAAVFPNAYATSSWTVPSVMSMFTARYPTQHGVIRVVDKVDTAQPMLPEVLAQQGYRTAAFITNPLVSAAAGFARGFDTFTVLAEDPTAASVRAASLAWLDTVDSDDRREPMFLYLHFMEPHWTYTPPQEYEERFAQPKLNEAARAKLAVNVGRAFRQFKGDVSGSHQLTCDEIAFLESLYDAEVAALDAEIAPIFAELERRHFLDDAIVVITSDHGEEFLDHGHLWHAYALYDESVRVPLIVRLPGQQEGQTITRPVSLLDLAPSLLELLGLPGPAPFEDRSFAGLLSRPTWLPSSVLGLFDRSSTDERQIVAQLHWSDTEKAHRLLHTAMVIDRSMKLLTRPDGSVELYDLASDPSEQRALPGLAPDRQAALLASLAGIERSSARDGSPRETVDLDDTTRERLAALGYLPDAHAHGATDDAELAQDESGLPHAPASDSETPVTDPNYRTDGTSIRRAGCAARADFVRAAGEGNFVVVAAAIDAGIDLNVADEHGASALVRAAEGGHRDIVHALIARGARVNTRGRSALAAAAEQGRIGVLDVLLEHGADLNAVDWWGAGALLRAAENGRVDAIEVLLAAGANCELRNREGVTPLIAAAANHHAAAVSSLLAHGADAQASAVYGHTALNHAAANGAAGTIAVLLAHGAAAGAALDDGTTALMQAAQAADVESVRLLVAGGADVNAKTVEGETALMEAASIEALDIAALLLAHGADVNATTEDQTTALHVAVEDDDEELVELLLEYGADPQAADDQDETPITIAHDSDSPAIVKMLNDAVTARQSRGAKSAALDAKRSRAAEPRRQGS